MFAPRDLAKQTLFVAAQRVLLGTQAGFWVQVQSARHTFLLSLVPFLLFYSSWGKLPTSDMASKQRHNSRWNGDKHELEDGLNTDRGMAFSSNHETTIFKTQNGNICTPPKRASLTTQNSPEYTVGGDRGAGARENRGREGHGRREKKGREAGSLRWREAGEKLKKASFRYLLLLISSSQRNEPNNFSWLPFNVSEA